MCRKRQRKQRLLLVVLSISFLGAYGFSSEQNGQYCFPVQRIETRRTLQAPFDGRRISRTLTEASPKTRRHWHLLASPILPDDSVFQNAVDFNEKGVSLGLDVESFALSGRIAQTTFFWLMLQEGVEEGGAARTAEVVAFGLFSSFLIVLGSMLFIDRNTEMEMPKNANPDAYRRAKSGKDLLDPYRNWDDLYLNYNEGSGPFGFKKNAEIWNGRVAMLSFVWVVAQEVATDKGILNSLRNGESSAVTALACFLTLIGGFTSIIVSVDEEEKDFVERVVSKEALQKNAADPNWRPETVTTPYYPLKPSTVAQVSDPLTYDDYVRLSSVDGGITKPPAKSSPEPTDNESRIQQYGDESSTGNQPVSYQIIPPKNPSPLWSATQRSRPRPRTYANIVDEGRRNRLPAYGIPAAKPLVVSALKDPYRQSARLPVSELRLFDKTELETEIQKISRAYDTSQWSFELAELWNGRFAQIAFVAVFAQETVQRKGVLRGIEQSNPTNLVGLLSVFLAMVGVGAAFTVGVGESQVSARAPALLYKHLRETQTTVATEETADPSNFKVDGYRFKEDTPTTIAIGYSSTHPGGNFHFNANNSNAIREGAGIPTEKPDPSNYKVDGYRFQPNTPTTIAIGDSSPHPAGSFSFNDENTEAIQSSEQQQPATEPDPSNFKVGGYRFKQSTQSAIHPGGKFQFGDDTSSAIQIGAGIPIEPVEAQPPKDMTPHPVKSFVFGPENEPVIKSATRNTSVPSPNEWKFSSYGPNDDQYENSPTYTSTSESLSATSNGYIPPPNYESPEYTQNEQEQAVQQHDETSLNKVAEGNPVYVGVNGATNQYLNSLSSRWEE